MIVENERLFHYNQEQGKNVFSHYCFATSGNIKRQERAIKGIHIGKEEI
jgi:hypothetical protein